MEDAEVTWKSNADWLSRKVITTPYFISVLVISSRVPIVSQFSIGFVSSSAELSSKNKKCFL